MLKSWSNGEKSEIIKAIIENNFRILGKHLPNNMLSLTTTERTSLTSDYLSEGLVVFDNTLKKWFEYKNGFWIDYPITITYSASINIDDWIENTIYIPYSTHFVESPAVQLFILSNNGYEPVIGGVSVDNNYNIVLKTDFPYEGKVVIK